MNTVLSILDAFEIKLYVLQIKTSFSTIKQGYQRQLEHFFVQGSGSTTSPLRAPFSIQIASFLRFEICFKTLVLSENIF